MSKRVALVLGSGGARGYAHIGVIDELEARGYKIDCIAGCSMGAVIGGVYASGTLGAFREWVEAMDYLDVMRLLDVSFSMGAIRGEKIFGQIREIVGDVRIESLPFPFTAVATDLANQQEVWFQEGCLNQAMRASAAIPSLFTPVTLGRRVLVDGGLLNPLPIVPVVSSHCDLIVAVNLSASGNRHYALPFVERPKVSQGYFDHLVESLSSHLTFWRRDAEDVPTLMLPEDIAPNDKKSWVDPSLLGEAGPASMLELINQSFEVMQNSLAQYKIAGYPPDVLISIPRRSCRFFEFYRASEMIQLGRVIAREALDHYEAR